MLILLPMNVNIIIINSRLDDKKQWYRIKNDFVILINILIIILLSELKLKLPVTLSLKVVFNVFCFWIKSLNFFNLEVSFMSEFFQLAKTKINILFIFKYYSIVYS